jgi:putative endonuclease
VLYIGVTNDIGRRIAEHKSGQGTGFSAQYLVRQLVYLERTMDAGSAIRREKQLKGWRRSKKVALIESGNPEWRDLAIHAPEILRSFDCAPAPPALRSG